MKTNFSKSSKGQHSVPQLALKQNDLLKQNSNFNEANFDSLVTGKFNFNGSCDSSTSTQNTDLPPWEEDDHHLPFLASTSKEFNGFAPFATTPRYAGPSSQVLNQGQLYHEETKNFWKPNRGIHVTMLKHTSCHCLELITTDATERHIEANNGHIFVDLIKLTQKCSLMIQDTEDDEILFGITRSSAASKKQGGSVTPNPEMRLKRSMTKYLMDRISISSTDGKKKHGCTDDFFVVLRPQLGDAVKIIDGLQQLDVICTKPRQLLVTQDPIKESASSDDMERAHGPIHVLNVPFGFYDGEEGDVMSEAEDENDSDGDEEEDDEKLKEWERQHHATRQRQLLQATANSDSWANSICPESQSRSFYAPSHNASMSSCSIDNPHSLSKDKTRLGPSVGGFTCYDSVESLSVTDVPGTVVLSAALTQSAASTDTGDNLSSTCSSMPTPRWYAQTHPLPVNIPAPDWDKVTFASSSSSPTNTTKAPTRLPSLMPIRKPSITSSNGKNIHRKSIDGITVSVVEDDIV